MKISVIIPTFNRRRLVSRAIDSVKAQTSQPFEIIIADDGSTDKTDEMIRRNYPQVKYFKQENKGVSAARNLGIRNASGDWIALLDSDDEWLPEKLEKQAAALLARPEFRFCHTDEIWIRNGRRVNPKLKHRKFGGDVFAQSLPLCIISPSSVLVHREYFDRFGVFDESLPVCEDYDLWLRITAFKPVLFVPEKLLIKYGGHGDQLSHAYWGMDRFRINAMARLLSNQQIEKQKKAALIDALITKIEIYIQGTIKHRNDADFKRYSHLLEIVKNANVNELSKWEEVWKAQN